MPFQMVRNDITKMRVDAIVNAAKPSLLGGGGVDGAIHKAAGPGLLEECAKLGGCAVGQAKITGAYDLPCRYVIHTVGPVWHGGLLGEKRKLASCYRESLELAKAYGCESIAFPLISSGAYGYPKDKALQVAVACITDFLLENEMTVYLTLFGKESLAQGRKLFSDIREYIDDQYAAQRERRRANRREDSLSMPTFSAPQAAANAFEETAESCAAPSFEDTMSFRPCAAPKTERKEAIGGILDELDESFQQMLLRKIDERGMTDAQCYKKANVDRKLFSKIRGDVHYKPKKTTALAFAVALELDLRETEELLGKAGYALSRSFPFDLILRYFIERGNYNIYEINEALFYYDQSLLGS